MGFLDRFKKKKEKVIAPKVKAVKKIATDLEIICSDDKEAFGALYNTMLLEPRKIRVSIEEAVKRAENSEKSGDIITAVVWYKTAGGLAIYQGDVPKVKKYFGKCKKLSNENYKILEIPERAVKKAQEYYQKYLKAEEEE